MPTDKLSGSDRLISTLNKVPLFGRLSTSFVSEARRRRIEDTVYLRQVDSLIDRVNEEFEKLADLPEERMRGKTEEFRRRIRDGLCQQIGPTLDDLTRKLEGIGKPQTEIAEVVRRVAEGDVDHLIRRQLKLLEDGDAYFDHLREIEQDLLADLLPEAFAVVKETCRRHRGQAWEAAGSDVQWDMVPFDVQIAGALELHDGNVVEMSTGEGKTLVALMPLYLNALLGLGSHLITVNDYLARRDSEWMGKILEYLGLTVGCLDKSEPGSPERIEAYRCDVTYGTNNEFGFDYLRDNMAIDRSRVVQRGHHFAIIDEVDSILIDEARTPLIISGPVERSTQQFDKLKPLVSNIVRRQNNLIAELATEAEKMLADGDDAAAGERLMWCMKGAPKHPRVAKLFQEPRHKRLATQALDLYTLEKRMPELEDILHFTIDEKGHSCDLTEKGRDEIAPNNPDAFVIFDLVDEIAQIDNEETDPARKTALKAEARRRHEERSEELHNISQLLRAYMLYEKDVEYVVQDNKVTIVDEFTGRLMHGRRWSDGLHQAVEAKEGVKVERETQTLATITIQNYFRMYEKLAGMTGTAETDAGEFGHTYKMAVQRIPTNRPVARDDGEDVIYKTRREKYNALLEEIEWLNSHGTPILVGTVSVEVSETLSRMLRRKRIPCNVLNAKQHQREAEVIAHAGQRGAVTIATNMAGRGTDIKLGAGVIRCEKSADFGAARCPGCPWAKPGDEVDEEMPTCGLQVIGSERHDSRRIDRQLRGRSGRQGDPGASRFFLSFEDDLLRLFLSERAVSMVTKWGKMEEGEQIASRLLTRQIGKAQSKVEAMNFDRRKRTLEYDDVMNKQRDVIYTRRANALFAAPEEAESIVLDTCAEAIEEALEAEYTTDDTGAPLDVKGFAEWVQRSVPYVDFTDLAERESPPGGSEALASWQEEFLVEVMQRVKKAFAMKAEMLGPELTLRLTQFVILQTIDGDWRDHLLAMDELRAGIGLRGYAQQNPLHEYQQEAYRAFDDMMSNINRQIFERWFRLQVVQQPPPGAEAGRGQVRAGRGMSPALQRAMQQRAQGEPPAPGPETPQGPQEGLPPEAMAAGGRRVRPQPFKRDKPKVKPNDPCPCGSGKKHKKCCGRL